jgi:hypothetical protein
MRQWDLLACLPTERHCLLYQSTSTVTTPSQYMSESMPAPAMPQCGTALQTIRMPIPAYADSTGTAASGDTSVKAMALAGSGRLYLLLASGSLWRALLREGSSRALSAQPTWQRLWLCGGSDPCVSCLAVRAGEQCDDVATGTRAGTIVHTTYGHAWTGVEVTAVNGLELCSIEAVVMVFLPRELPRGHVLVATAGAKLHWWVSSCISAGSTYLSSSTPAVTVAVCSSPEQKRIVSVEMLPECSAIVVGDSVGGITIYGCPIDLIKQLQNHRTSCQASICQALCLPLLARLPSAHAAQPVLVIRYEAGQGTLLTAGRDGMTH